MINEILRELKRWLKQLQQQLMQLVNGLSGRDRRESHRLARLVTALQAERNSLWREIEDLVQTTDTETQQLKLQIERLKGERDDLQLSVWELEQQVEDLLAFITHQCKTANGRFEESVQTDNPLAHISVDLSNFNLALVGGHSATRRAVIDELMTQYNLRTWVEIPPFSQSHMGRNKLKAKLRFCDLVVLITGYMNHSLTESIYSLKQSGALTGEVILLNCRGKSGVVREILNQVIQTKS